VCSALAFDLAPLFGEATMPITPRRCRRLPDSVEAAAGDDGRRSHAPCSMAASCPPPAATPGSHPRERKRRNEARRLLGLVPRARLAGLDLDASLWRTRKRDATSAPPDRDDWNVANAIARRDAADGGERSCGQRRPDARDWANADASSDRVARRSGRLLSRKAIARRARPAAACPGPAPHESGAGVDASSHADADADGVDLPSLSVRSSGPRQRTRVEARGAVSARAANVPLCRAARVWRPRFRSTGRASFSN
jgi:hypothetical protein